jgi:hypothetical protein
MPRAQTNRPGPLCWLAIGFCEQPEFYERFQVRDAAEAKTFILRTCGVTSRKELDTNPEAAARFHERVRRPFAYGDQS